MQQTQIPLSINQLKSCALLKVGVYVFELAVQLQPLASTQYLAALAALAALADVHYAFLSFNYYEQIPQRDQN